MEGDLTARLPIAGPRLRPAAAHERRLGRRAAVDRDETPLEVKAKVKADVAGAAFSDLTLTFEQGDRPQIVTGDGAGRLAHAGNARHGPFIALARPRPTGRGSRGRQPRRPVSPSWRPGCATSCPARASPRMRSPLSRPISPARLSGRCGWRWRDRPTGWRSPSCAPRCRAAAAGSQGRHLGIGRRPRLRRQPRLRRRKHGPLRGLGTRQRAADRRRRRRPVRPARRHRGRSGAGGGGRPCRQPGRDALKGSGSYKWSGRPELTVALEGPKLDARSLLPAESSLFDLFGLLAARPRQSDGARA